MERSSSWHSRWYQFHLRLVMLIVLAVGLVVSYIGSVVFTRAHSGQQTLPPPKSGLEDMIYDIPSEEFYRSIEAARRQGSKSCHSEDLGGEGL